MGFETEILVGSKLDHSKNIHMDKKLIHKVASLADDLEKSGFTKEASELDDILAKVSEPYDSYVPPTLEQVDDFSKMLAREVGSDYGFSGKDVQRAWADLSERFMERYKHDPKLMPRDWKDKLAYMFIDHYENMVR